ncbi:fumarylacetoacetate hydrolase family protein [Burkholderia pseudomultivorans]|uniref:Fumarylacetoacetase-like C-terminal domain-containing protein n=1 Tax=Burkholderia pseudomultivorans TaxID=1207504 RepID=A0ABU2DXN4_9BURK|nr:fumarylacetoacetate hydrolase family protein [Burkholderia pseudomultivorans]MDR8726369.1 putative protein YisK [Burkholderia pseudomultivorans]MDR8733593.1 putative protein YisK [Burkholderia pseudomultivorans]MDR8740119.1 putative protein YisK [Burkholderia pseudomultivorans]MDR8752213.1 putative protein YisK [Burkholderia pseudomultivorans]MDR8776608.1 putative protein YisK [Burkholderia pseudomultivorans]
MKLATYQINGAGARIGALTADGTSVIDLRQACRESVGVDHPAFGDMLSLMRAGQSALDIARSVVESAPRDAPYLHALGGIRLLAPVPVPEQIRDFSTFDQHMKFAGSAIARLRARRRSDDTASLPSPDTIALPPVYYEQPVYYKANRFNVIGHDGDVRWPRHAKLLDYEAEFGIFIGRVGRDISQSDAGSHIFGFSIFNDFSARDIQEHEMEAPFGPAKGKDFDTGNAIGPWIVTPDEIGNPYDLAVVVRVNGEEWSRGSTAGMRHRFERIIEHTSRDETLYVGEFLGSGTVGGGCGLELDRWIQRGDVVEIEIEKIGVLRNRVVA